ncbi:hypothetical protein QZH41_001783 [Actinostola sp. cb2023]|nr:hypothetical protein QZH41_001783 [Actinostola sp. cb2023]
MWDFTVRGWREADIAGMENLFEDPKTATTQQQDVKTMTYAETKIEANPEHKAKWRAFKERNLLRKLNLSLNGIRMSSQEIMSSSNEELQCQAAAAEKQKQEKQALYILDIPSVDEEHPDLSDKPSRIFPLPISHENQCKILGVANNLELFSEEFGFSCKKEEKFLPLKNNGKEFDLDRAYQRYSFIKALDRHKEEQNKYVQILRMEDNMQPSNEEDSDDQLLEAIIDIDPIFDLESDLASGDEFE